MCHQKKIFKKINITKTIFYQNKIDSEKNNMKQLYKTFDGLLNIKEKIKYPIHNEYFQTFLLIKFIMKYHSIQITI